MLGEALAKILRSRLGQYLDTEELEVKVAFNKPIELTNVKLKESVLNDADIPLRCVYGKVESLKIQIPWTSLYNSPTVINIQGLYMLMVPTTSVGYDKEKEEKAEYEAKMAKITAIEEAKKNKLLDQKGDDNDGFIQKVLANIFKNLKVTITDIHIRFEYTQTNSDNFGAGVTLHNLEIWTNKESGSKSDSKQRSFNKLVKISSLGVYWQPKERTLYSCESNYHEDSVIDGQFRTNIASQDSGVRGLKYLLGPISMDADLTWVPNPKRFDFARPLIDLRIMMSEMRLKVTKNQYQDFALLLHSFNAMTLAARYRKYKAECNLEGVTSYRGHARQLWRFALESVLEEDVRPRLRMWSPVHIRDHIAKCTEYRDRYKGKLLGVHTIENDQRLQELEKILDAFNINVNRERAEILVDNQKKHDAEAEKNSSWFGGWWGGKKSQDNDQAGIRSLGKKMSDDDKKALYEAIDYHEEAEEGILEFPKRFVKFKVVFQLHRFIITIQDDNVASETSVLCLTLENVNLDISQRPAASNFKIEVTMENLTVTGLKTASRQPPKLIKTVKHQTTDSKLLNFAFETNPPNDPYGNLDDDEGSLYDRNLSLTTSPLEIIYDAKTIYALRDVFRVNEVNVGYLQEAALDGIKEYKDVKMSQLGWEFARENHVFFKVNIRIESPYFVFPKRGEYYEGCPSLIANLGSVTIRSKEVTQNMVDNKRLGAMDDVPGALDVVTNWQEQAYDQFSIHLANMELMMSKQGEDWKTEMMNRDSKLFMLKPINLEVVLKMCLIHTDPDFPVFKLSGDLPNGIAVNIEEKRLMLLAEVAQDIIDPDDDMKYEAPPPALRRTDSDGSFQSAVSSIETVSSLTGYIGRKQATAVPATVPKQQTNDKILSSKVTKLRVDLHIRCLLLEVEEDEKPLFRFQLEDLSARLTKKNYNMTGQFGIGGCQCHQTKFKMPDGSPVALLSTSISKMNQDHLDKLLVVDIQKLEEKSPDWAGVHLAISANMSSVDLCLHQDAILDLAKEAASWITKIQAKAGKLMGPAPGEVDGIKKRTSGRLPGTATPTLAKLTRTSGIRRLSRQSSGESGPPNQPRQSIKQVANLQKKRRKQLKEAIDLKVTANLQSVKADLMTTKVNFATIQVENLGTEVKLAKSKTEMDVKLQNFKIYDKQKAFTLYEMIAECTGDQVLDVNIEIYDMLTEKEKEMGMPDIKVKINMGQIKFVFLMKFISDLLIFIDPFTNMKEFIKQQALEAYDISAKVLEEGYNNATRIKLDISLDAPIIVLPVSSRKKETFEANLGKLRLQNNHHYQEHYAHLITLDTMNISLSEMRLNRTRIAEGRNDNSTVGSCEIIKPIDFELEVTRNMDGAMTEVDIPEIQVKGTLHEIRIELSKDDYNALIAMVIENFQEKGVMEPPNKSASMPKKSLNLPLESKHDTKYTSQASISSRRSLDVITKGKSPKAKLAEFDINFKGMKMKIFTGPTDLTKIQSFRDAKKALAQIAINNLTVNGDYRVSGALKADVNLNDVILEDKRPTIGVDTGNRIVKLLESKKVGEKKEDMIRVKYTKDEQAQENVTVHINSFVVVASVSYLLEIANFFIPEEIPDFASLLESSGQATNVVVHEESDADAVLEPLVRTVLVKMDEPDIVLVNNIEDINTDAIMLNAELAINLTMDNDRMSFLLTVDGLRGHTCKFNPERREQSLAQILQPTNMGMHFSQDNDTNRTRIDINFNHLVFNVSPASIYIIYNSYNTFMENLSALENEDDDYSEAGSGSTPGESEQLWETTPYSEDELWYLKPDEAMDPLFRGGDTVSLASTLSLVSDQQLMFNINQLIVKVEAGLGNNTIPMILLESKLTGEVRNWSGRLSVLASTQLEMAYYNSKFALWEPVIEPIGNLTNTGRTSYNRWSLDIRYQANSSHDLGSAVLSPNFAVDDVDGFICPENLPPLTEIGVHSTETLQITITKSFLAVLSSLAESFSPSALKSISEKEVSKEPFLVVNKTGLLVTLVLGQHKNYSFSVSDKHHGGAQVEVQSDCQQALHLKFNRHSADNSYRSYISPLRMQSDESEVALKIKLKGYEKKSFEIPINKADSRFFKFPFTGSEFGYEPGIVSTVHVENGTKFVILTSILSFKNNYPGAIRVWYEVNNRFQNYKLDKGECWNCPLHSLYTHTGRFFFSVDGEGQNMSIEDVDWRSIGAGHKSSNFRKTIECTNTNAQPPVYLNIEGSTDEIFNERSSDLSQVQYQVSIRPSVVIKNCLPVPLYYKCGGQTEETTLEEGQIGCLEDIKFGQTMISFKLYGWRQTDLQCHHVYNTNMKTLEYWRFESAQPDLSSLKIDLGVMKDESKGTVVLSIFAPFWFVNKTQRRLHFKGHDGATELIHYPEEEKIPLMFSYISKSLLGKKKINMKVENSLWSDAFTIDTIGDTGKITCKLDSRRGSLKRNFQKSDKKSDDSYQVGIQISQSSSSFTKIVTFTPYYMIYNSAHFDIVLKELEEEGDGVVVGAGQCVPFWPIYGGQSVVCGAKDHPGYTVPFSISEPQPTLLMLSNRFGGIYVRVKTDNSSQTLVTLSGYKPGYAPVLLVNNLPTWDIEYGDQGSNNRKYLKPGEKVLFTWEKPSSVRILNWSVCYKDAKVYENTLKTDEFDAFKIGHGQLAWVSFLDGMQRVLLFTNQPVLAQQLAKTTGESERIEQEIDVSIYGVGVSLVNNDMDVRRELAYLSVTSSNIVWEIRKEGKQRYKSLTTGQCNSIEHDFMVYSRLLAIGKNPPPQRVIENGAIIVNYVDERMEQPHKGRLRRQFQKGLWCQMRTSKHQRQFHLKINHVQLDNQLTECLYPVIAAPVPPPRSVTAVSVPKPFIELSILEYTSPEHNLKQYKYIHALVQEMHLKIELGFINALSELFEEEEILEENTGEKLELDLNHARKELKDHAILTVSQGKKDFYDYLHLSPLKVHVSFSLTSYNARREGVASNRGSNFIKHLLQSFGVTITDSNDIIFRLAYFERKHQFFNFDDLMSEMTRHYTSQAIKQMYVILLGLDVIGNPFGLAVGVARSVEDLFYEPFQGAVEGPSEFAEGLAIGVRSVFSGVVGGAAGTVSKITGTIGKGLASLTFDEKFQQKRRERINRRKNHDNLAVGMARNFRDLGMGFVGGVSGVALKPIEGARDEGVGGFFKGVGKGVAGLVARPTGGIVDFASGTFDTVKRATEVNEEVASRARPGRYIHPDGVVRNYDEKEAMGARMVRQVDKGRLAKEVYIMHENIIGNKEMLVLTNMRVVYIQHNAVLGGWTSHWEYLYSDVVVPTPIEKEGAKWYIIISAQEERKTMLGGLFNNKSSGKKIFLPEGFTRETAQSLARMIQELKTNQDNWESVFIKMILEKSK